MLQWFYFIVSSFNHFLMNLYAVARYNVNDLPKFVNLLYIIHCILLILYCNIKLTYDGNCTFNLSLFSTHLLNWVAIKINLFGSYESKVFFFK